MEILNTFGERSEVIVPIQDEQNKMNLPLLPLSTVLPVAIIFQVTTIVHITLRLVYRRKTHVTLGGDDWFLVAATVFANILCILCCWEAAVAEEHPEAVFVFNIVLPAPSVSTAAVNTFCCITTLLFTKISILLLYKRIFPQRWLHVIVYCFFVCISIWWVMFLVISIVLSERLQSFYNSDSTSSYSIKQLSMATEALVVLDVICKFHLLVLPIPIVVRLQMSWSRKIQVIALFVVGCVCVMSSAIRFTCVYRLMTSLSSNPSNVQEFAALVRNSFIWTIVDACLGINEACLPTIKQLVELWMGKDAKSSDRGSFLSSDSDSSSAVFSSIKSKEKKQPVVRETELSRSDSVTTY